MAYVGKEKIEGLTEYDLKYLNNIIGGFEAGDISGVGTIDDISARAAAELNREIGLIPDVIKSREGYLPPGYREPGHFTDDMTRRYSSKRRKYYSRVAEGKRPALGDYSYFSDPDPVSNRVADRYRQTSEKLGSYMQTNPYKLYQAGGGGDYNKAYAAAQRQRQQRQTWNPQTGTYTRR
jgi:hypothetical protein